MVSRKFPTLIISIITLIIYSISTNLISKLETSKFYIDQITADLVNSEKNWDITTINLSERKWENSSDFLSLKNFNCTSNTVSIDGLKGILHRNKNNRINSVEIYSLDIVDMALEFKFEFDYEMVTTIPEQNETIKLTGKGSIELASREMHYDKVFTAPEYKVASFLDLKMDYIGCELDEPNVQVGNAIDSHMKNDKLLDADSMITKLIKENLIEYNTITERNKLFTLTTNFPERNYSISYNVVDQSLFNSDETVVSFIEGLVLDHDEVIEEDTNITGYIQFDNKECSGTEQLFIHDKLAIDLFKLGYEKKLFIVDQEKINSIKFKALFNRMNMNWLSKFYPDILNFKPIDAEFFFEFYVNQVKWNGVTGRAEVKYTFYFLSTDDKDLLIELDVYVGVSLDVVDATDKNGHKTINYQISGGENLSLEKFSLRTPKSGVRFDSNKFYKFVEDFLAAYFKFDNYLLFKNYENFKNLIGSFNTVRKVERGLILCNGRTEIKFLEE